MTGNRTKRLFLVATALSFWSLSPSPAPAQTVSFAPRADFVSGTTPMTVAVGDFNGDGVPDLAVANDVKNNVAVLLVDSDGNFRAHRLFTVVAHPVWVA